MAVTILDWGSTEGAILAVKIGRPGYRVSKQFDPETKQRSLLFQCPSLAIMKHDILHSLQITVCNYDLLVYLSFSKRLVVWMSMSGTVEGSSPTLCSAAVAGVSAGIVGTLPSVEATRDGWQRLV
ncbi:hypothetical protein ZIOFF_021409 [Zingiber officinale]|uniref:Uncharacterized protein n=1 Tax=Zingiber officinale TaxID=94328 RepID=A0A8J5H1F1_ZINOF|nr:hypothetical protein ZIOFF_021409 [Zingiber officinale]